MTAHIARAASHPGRRHLSPSSSRLTRSSVVWACAVCVGAGLAGCARKAAPRPTVTTVVYTVRGQVARLPTPNDPASEFMVKHEEIPDFRASLPDGPLGMKPMTMPFTLGPGVSIEGLHVGDKVAVRFSVDYAIPDGRLKDSRVVALTPLPADTALDFSVHAATPAPEQTTPAPKPTTPPVTPPAPGG